MSQPRITVVPVQMMGKVEQYEIERTGADIRLYRRIPEAEYRRWYADDRRIIHTGGVRKLFLKCLTPEEAVTLQNRHIFTGIFAKGVNDPHETR